MSQLEYINSPNVDATHTICQHDRFVKVRMFVCVYTSNEHAKCKHIHAFTANNSLLHVVLGDTKLHALT